MPFSKNSGKIQVSAEFEEGEWLVLCVALGALTGAGFHIGERTGWTLVSLVNQLLDGAPYYTPYEIPVNGKGAFKPKPEEAERIAKNLKALEAVHKLYEKKAPKKVKSLPPGVKKPTTDKL